MAITSTVPMFVPNVSAMLGWQFVHKLSAKLPHRGALLLRMISGVAALRHMNAVSFQTY